MSRAFWFAAGAASSVYALVKAKRTAENLSPDGIAARVAAYGVGARLIRAEVAAGMAERETELREQLRSGGSSRVIEGPTTPGHHDQHEQHEQHDQPTASRRREGGTDGHR